MLNVAPLDLKIFYLLLLLLSGCNGSSNKKNITPPTEDKITVNTSVANDEATGSSRGADTVLPLCENAAKVSASSFDLEYPLNNPESDIAEKLLTSFVVKEPAGVSAVNYPISIVIPLPLAEYFYAGDFHIKNSSGEIVPAQFNVLNRWWAKDRSLRHIQAHFNVDLPAYDMGQIATGREIFYLYSGTSNKPTNNPVCTKETTENISVSNGLVTIDIQKQPLVINTPSGKLTSLLMTEYGEIDKSFNHENIQIELEELGPQRTIIKMSSSTIYISPDEIKHGWVLRLYVYGNSHLVQADFQLQNSALNSVFSAPLYFKSHQLTLDASGSQTLNEVKAAKLSDTGVNSGKSGYITSPNVNVFMRDFWQRFPNGIKTSVDGELHVELYPSWSKQFLNKSFIAGNYYWLDDMRQTYKEVLFDFSTQRTIEDIERIATHFQYPPVGIIPQEYYQETQVTIELGGFFPLTDLPIEPNRLPEYKMTDFTKLVVGSSLFGQNNFGLDLNRKIATSITGGVPYSNRQFFITGNPKDYYFAQNMAAAEVNIRPQWLSGYVHDNNYPEIKPTTNPYAGSTWRKFIGHGVPTTNRNYKTGTKQVANPRDDQHAWFYHVEQAYLMSGNKWLKDWFQFMAEFKQAYLNELDPWPDRTNRSEGHALNVALASYRVTGNKGLGNLLSKYTQAVHSKYLLAPHNISVGNLTKKNPSAAVFQQGYLAKAFINLYYEFPDQALTLQLIKNHVDWNFLYANFSYYRSVIDYEVSPSASGSGMSFIDVAIWYSLYSGDTKYAEHATQFITNGIGGVKPYGKWSTWQGQYQAQLYNYYLQQLSTTYN